MDQKTCATLLFTVLLIHSYVLLSTVAGGRKLLEVEEEMEVTRRMNVENTKDYTPVEANHRHDPDLNPHVDPPPQAEPPSPTAPPSETDPSHDIVPSHDRYGIDHHVHHQHPSAEQTINNPAPAPTTTIINDGV
ncbi:uncharacterized protein LOC141692999 [Apium graveolens]|uniref:uncharacterized protein LOC141692999 n=1 Tax=Apium graveolens TaxID=4045 RepID=UPI003D78DF8D